MVKMLISSVLFNILCSFLSVINSVVNDKIIRFTNLQFLVLRSVLSGDVKGKKTGEQGVQV